MTLLGAVALMLLVHLLRTPFPSVEGEESEEEEEGEWDEVSQSAGTSSPYCRLFDNYMIQRIKGGVQRC